jgi:hypothetical protein
MNVTLTPKEYIRQRVSKEYEFPYDTIDSAVEALQDVVSL